MATKRDDPYGAYNFMVEIDGVESAAFSEVTGLSVEIAAIDYREGSDVTNRVRKLPGLHKVGDVTLKRGVTGDLTLFAWVRAILQGNRDFRGVVIILLDDSRRPVLRWQLSGAWPIKWEGPTLNAAANEVAVESLTLTCDSIEID